MTDLLLFQLRAPMAAFGTVAPGERRETLESPGHAALAGCLAAALGLRRTDERLVRFTAALAFAVRIDQLGPTVADYNTAQVPPASRNRTWATRRAELEVKAELNTILSRRDYRFGCAFTIAAMAQSPDEDLIPLLNLETLTNALRNPTFSLYLGRKSCPLGAPPQPAVIPSPGSLHEAFRAYDQRQSADPCDFRTEGRSGTLADDAFIVAGLVDPETVSRRVERRDALVSRIGWRFDRRSVPVLRENTGEPPGAVEGGLS